MALVSEVLHDSGRRRRTCGDYTNMLRSYGSIPRELIRRTTRGYMRTGTYGCSCFGGMLDVIRGGRSDDTVGKAKGLPSRAGVHKGRTCG